MSLGLVNDHNLTLTLDQFNCDETGLLYRASPDRSSSLRTVMAQKAQKTGLPYSLPAVSQEITETTCHWGVTKHVVLSTYKYEHVVGLIISYLIKLYE